MGRRLHFFLVAGAITAGLLTVAAGVVRTGSFFGYKNYVVPQDGMVPTILEGEQILVDLNAYERIDDVRRGDVIIFEYPVDRSLDFVYRVIGLPLDTLSIRGRHIYVNGKPLPQRQLTNVDGNITAEEELGGRTYQVAYTVRKGRRIEVHNWIVGENALYVLGDNREHALDSRSWGEVPFELVQGKAIRIYLPKRFGRLFRRL